MLSDRLPADAHVADGSGILDMAKVSPSIPSREGSSIGLAQATNIRACTSFVTVPTGIFSPQAVDSACSNLAFEPGKLRYLSLAFPFLLGARRPLQLPKAVEQA